ncbi:aspartate carbamoyltransferase catalytic subunit [Elongatibacter sediminis]|uniref:Aspartate carbamoyltransferase n=1 Tax=Elongatibacter sediminis TaxID=3119006 RepID=A0AAW9RAV3_9GAMM
MRENPQESEMAKPLEHFTHTDPCTDDQLHELVNRALQVAGNAQAFANALSGRLLINLFYEPSTRTRISFETAAKRLGMHVVNISATGSSVEKGESLFDTFDTLQAMQPDFIVVRHRDEGVAEALAERAEPGLHVINAGDGTRAHPTQALLDAVTLQQAFGDLRPLKIAMAGDIRHSRVARSSLALFPRLGVADIRLAGPADFLPTDAERDGVRICRTLDEAIDDADAIIMLRIQKERISGLSIPSDADYHAAWGLTESRLERAAPGCRVLHPGPINRGVEIADSVADGPRSLIRRQVRNGLHTRMALLLELDGHGAYPGV